MFSKRAKGAPKPDDTTLPATLPVDAAARGKRMAPSLLSESLTIEGNLDSEGEVQLDGTIRGDVRVASLTVGETGHIEGQVFCDTIEVRGRVIGTITAKQVRLYGTAYVDGDITHEQLAVESGAFFQGRSLKFQRPTAALEVVSTEEPAAAKAV